MQAYLLVAAGGALGAVARFGLSEAMARAFGPGFPWGTLAANVLGGLVMGVLAGAVKDRALLALLGAGVLGGFTTFSAFSLETVRLFEAGRFDLGALYVGASLAGAIGAVVLGLTIARSFAS